MRVTSEYDGRRLEHIRTLQQIVADELPRRGWTSDEFAAERLRRIRSLIAHAKAHSPWHRDRLRDIDPSDVTEQTLSALPTMTKFDLMAHWDDIVCDPRLSLSRAEDVIEEAQRGEVTYLFGEYQVIASGGSSGTRGVFVWDFEGLARGVAVAFRFQRWVSQEFGTVTPLRTAYVQATNPGHASNLVARCFGDPKVPAIHLSPRQPVSELVGRINEFQPTQLVGYPSALHVLAEAALGGRLRVRLQRVQCQAEPLLAETRALLIDAFAAPVLELYGASECANLAQGWPGEDFLRLAEDNAVLEPVDDTGAPTEPGQPSSRLYLTNLLNKVLPLIRYELNDELTWVPDTDSTRPGRAVRVAGRRDDAFRYGDLVIHPHVLRTILGRREIAEYQVRQRADGVNVAVRTSEDFDVAQLARAIEAGLASAGLVAPRATVTRVDALERHEGTGKLKRFVPL